jgi:hypothetical protein
MLYKEPVVRPVRILPRMAFVSGGIEVSFPISHTPVQLETVHYEVKEIGQRVYVWFGEQERRFGMNWTVEFSLGQNDQFLTQRVRFSNSTSRAHNWTSWSNTAVAARPDTQLHFPSGPVLAHGNEVKDIDWGSQGPATIRELDRMMGYFWKAPDVNAFGVFTPSLGSGLYHISDRAVAPGIKLWTYGTGDDERWSNVSTLTKECYLEIQGGPISDQSIKHQIEPGAEMLTQEFWISSANPLNIRELKMPDVDLIPADQMPLFTWPPCESVDYWQQVLAAYRRKDVSSLPERMGLDSNNWAISGSDDLEKAFEWLIEITSGTDLDFWRFQYGAWLAGR